MLTHAYIYDSEPANLQDARKLIRDLRRVLRKGKGIICKTKSGYHGVYRQHSLSLDRNYKAYYTHHGQYICLGYYHTAEEAARVYNEAVSKIKGRQYPLNELPPV